MSRGSPMSRGSLSMDTQSFEKRLGGIRSVVSYQTVDQGHRIVEQL